MYFFSLLLYISITSNNINRDQYLQHVACLAAKSTPKVRVSRYFVHIFPPRRYQLLLSRLCCWLVLVLKFKWNHNSPKYLHKFSFISFIGWSLGNHEIQDTCLSIGYHGYVSFCLFVDIFKWPSRKINVHENQHYAKPCNWPGLIVDWHVWKNVAQSCGQNDAHASAIYIVYDTFTKRCSLQFNTVTFSLAIYTQECLTWEVTGYVRNCLLIRMYKFTSTETDSRQPIYSSSISVVDSWFRVTKTKLTALTSSFAMFAR